MDHLLSRSECTAMRGLAILGIMLHNYCHWLQGIVRENEYTWQQWKVDQLWRVVGSPDEQLPLHLLSFFGHYGVPVFLFLSGYGLVAKYEASQQPSSRHALGSQERPAPSFWRFLRYNYLKLLRILIVGFVAFTLLDAVTPGMHRYHAGEVMAMLGMYANLLEHPSQVVWPGPYWYFSLTLQLYVVYWLVLRRWRHGGVLVGLAALCWVAQALCADDAVLLERLRYNFIGGAVPFVLGVVAGRYGQRLPAVGRAGWGALLLLSVVLVVGLSCSFQLWLWVPLFVVSATVALVRLLPAVLLRCCEWLGVLSAAVFVSHPLVRKVFVRPYLHDDVYEGLLLYVVASVAVAWLFLLIINRIPKPKL